MNKRNLILVIGIFLVTFAGVGFSAGVIQKFATDIMQIGIGSSADDKEVIFNTGDGASNTKIVVDDSTQKLRSSANDLGFGDDANTDKTFIAETGEANEPYLKYDATANKWVAANDGLTEQDIIASAGGGITGAAINMLNDSNPGFEDGTTNWTNVGGGTFTAPSSPTADIGLELQSGKWDAAAATDRLDSAVITIPPGLYGRTCTTEILYKGGDANIKLQAYDGSVVVEELILAVAATYTHALIHFTCPSTGTLQLRLEATADAAEILVDDSFLGGGVVKYNKHIVGIEDGIINKVCKFRIQLNGASCALIEDDGCIGSLTACSAGAVTVNWTTNYFSSIDYRLNCMTLETTTEARTVNFDVKVIGSLELENRSNTGALNNDPIECVVIGN